MDDLQSQFPPNTKMDKQEPSGKIIKGEVSGSLAPKKTTGEKFASVFLGGDLQQVKHYMVYDFFIPTLKNALLNCIEMLLFGTTPNRPGGNYAQSNPRYVNYSSYSRPQQPSSYQQRNQPQPQSNEARYDFSGIIFSTRTDAENVLTSMQNDIDNCGQTRVADLLDKIGRTAEFTDYRWGWKNLQGARVLLGRGGYYIDLPRVEVIR